MNVSPTPSLAHGQSMFFFYPIVKIFAFLYFILFSNTLENKYKMRIGCIHTTIEPHTYRSPFHGRMC